MIAMTISSSMSVKPDVFLWVECFCMTIPANVSNGTILLYAGIEKHRNFSESGGIWV